MNNECKCGRVLCDLCHENSAVVRMENKVNGNTLNCCRECYQAIWGDKDDGTTDH